MKKLNNKGFAISTIFYSIIIIGILIMAMLYSTLAFRKKSENDFVDTIEENMNKEVLGKSNCKILQNSAGGVKTGDVIGCDRERFYVISTNDNQVFLLAQTVLTQSSVGVRQIKSGETPIQAAFSKNYNSSGLEAASGKPYWVYYNIPSGKTLALKEIYGSKYSTFVFDYNSPIYTYIKEYQSYLREKLYVSSAYVTLVNDNQRSIITNSKYNSWVRISYNWYTGVATGESPSPQIYIVGSSGFVQSSYNSNNVYIRPVVVISKKEIGL